MGQYFCFTGWFKFMRLFQYLSDMQRAVLIQLIINFRNLNSQDPMSGKQEQPPQEDFKKLRETLAENVRKSNREEIISKRRNILENAVESNDTKDKLLIVDDRYSKEILTFLSSVYSMENFPELVFSINDPDILKQHYGLIGIRKILSVAKNPPIQPVIDAGLVPRMIEYVKQTEFPQLQLEATWALTNVASGTTIQCQSIIDKGGIPLFIGLLRSPNMGIVEQAIWAIGNISSDCVFYRDTILRNGGLQNLIAVIQKSSEPHIIKHGCWALSNLCRGSPLPKYESIKAAIPTMCQLIANDQLEDREVIADCCWAISYHSDSQKNKVDVIVESGMVPKIVSFIQNTYLSLVVPSIRIAGNISTGNTSQTEQLLKYDILSTLEKVLGHHKKVVRRQSCWVVSNIAAGVKAQVCAILNRPTLIKKILELFQTDTNDVKREICFIFSNMSHSGDPEQIFALYMQNAIVRYYVNLLSAEDAKTVQVALESLYMVLSVGQRFKTEDKNPLVMELHTMNAIDLLEKLQYHKSDNVYQNVSKILQSYFEIQDPLEL